MNRPLLVLRSPAGAAAHNMAVDEALLLNANSARAPVLRFYSWTEPAASFGYFQRYADVELLTPLRPLVRRPTGGGIVPHDADWTYSLAFPFGHDWHQLPATESYRRVHEWVRAAFGKIGVDCSLAPARASRIAGPGQCFAGCGWEQFDVLRLGRKIAGAAQRRNRDGLLIQGSVQPPAQTDRGSWEGAMLEIAAAEYAFEIAVFAPTPQFNQTASSLERDKYSQPDYNRKR